MEQNDDTDQAECERKMGRNMVERATLHRRIEALEERLLRLQNELDGCKNSVSQCNKQVPADSTAGDTQMAYSTRATIDSIRARLERVEADMRDTVDHERAAAVQRQNKNHRAE